MKISSLELKDFPPIKNLKIDELNDLVIIAGANGSGKTRLKNAIVQTLQGNPLMSLTLSSTKNEEDVRFEGNKIVVQQGQTNDVLNQYMQSRSFGRGRYVGSLVQIDSNRNIQTTQYPQISWQVSDPDDQATPYNWGYQEFTSRWTEFMNYIHQKVAAYQNKVASEVFNGSDITATAIKKKLPHPLKKYKEIFDSLLPGKELQDINPSSPSEFQYKDELGNTLSFNTLSSGEQEVIKILYDVARKDIKHSVIIVDEPELHLHPTLTFKLIESMKTIGDHTNQLIFLTHSADLISTYYSTGNVYFIDSLQSGSNQAHKLSELNHSHKELVQLIGENLGLFAVGKKLVFVEGKDASIDRLTYHAIAQKYLPEAKIIPLGSVANLVTLNSFEEQIRSSIFGIDLYMIRDRDGLSDSQIKEIEQNGKIKCLKKRHLENYFLDSDILFKVAQQLYIPTTKPEITRDFIESKIKEIASNLLNFNLLQNTKEYLGLNHSFEIPTVKSVETKDLETIKNEFTNTARLSIECLSASMSEDNLKQWMETEQKRLEKALTNTDWKNEFQGKNIFSVFCKTIFAEEELKIRQIYIDICLTQKPDVFNDMKEIFEGFK